MLINDRELLSFCDLTNLKLEFTNPIKKVYMMKDQRTKKDIKVIEYHTIHSLLSIEYQGLEERIELGLIKPIMSEELISYKEARKHDAYSKEKEKELNEITEGEEKFYNKVSLEKERGSFYKAEKEEDKIVVTDYIYQSKHELKKQAPLVTELFDRYNESIKKGVDEGHDGQFLKEWEIIHVADDYLLSKSDFDSFYDSRIQKLNESLNNLKDSEKLLTNSIIKRLEKGKKGCPKREDVEKLLKKEVLIEGIIQIIDSPLGEFIPGIPVENFIKKFKFLNFLTTNIIGDLSAATIIEHVGPFQTENFLEKLKASESRTNVPIKSEVIEYEIKFSFEGASLRVGVFKNANSKNIVFALANKHGLKKLEDSLEDGLIPKEVARLNILIKKIEADYPGYKITFTGVDKAGKLANILELISADPDSKVEYSSKGYFYNFPSFLPSIVDFTEKDLENTNLTFSYLTNHEILITSATLFSMSYAVFLRQLVKVSGGAYTNFLISLVTLGLNLIKDISNKTLYKEYLLFLEKEKIISNLSNNQIINYESGKIVGDIVLEDFDKVFDYKGVQVDLPTLLQLSAYEHFFGYKFSYEEENKIKLTKKYKLNEHVELILKNNKTYNTKKYKLVQKQREVSKVNKDFEEEDYFGEILTEILKIFKTLQDNYRKREETNNVQGYYLLKGKPTVINQLSYVIKNEEEDQEFKNLIDKKYKLPSYYYPYVNKEGNLFDKLDDNYVRTIIRSSVQNENGKTYSTDTLDVDGEKLNRALSTKVWSTVRHGQKSEELDRIITKRVNNFVTTGNVMHGEEVLKHLKPTGKIRDYYEIDEEDATTAYLILGIFDENLKYKTEEFGYVYHADDLQGRMVEEKLVLFGDPADLVKVTTTGVSSSAILKCDNGTVLGELKVTSQKKVTTNGLLDATEGDKAPLTNITPFGKCNLNRDPKGQPLPCEMFISLGSWSGVSKGSSIGGMKELISTSTITCNCGGEISILEAISTEITN